MILMGLTDWSAGAKWHRYRGHDIFYRDEGDGDVLLLIHGFPTCSWDWQAVWPSLTKRYRVIAMDMIGFGFSPKPVDYEYSISDQAGLVESLLVSLNVNQAHVLAHDYGDTVAQELLARFNQRQAMEAGADRLQLQSVCFLNGGLFPETHRPRLIQRLLISPLGPYISKWMGEPAFHRSFSAIFGKKTKPSQEELHNFWQMMVDRGGLRVLPKLIYYMEERRQHRERWVGALQKARIPLRVIDGTDDPVSGRHMTERYKQLVPNPDVVLLEGIGHYPQVEDPEGTLRGYLEFREKIRSAG